MFTNNKHNIPFHHLMEMSTIRSPAPPTKYEQIVAVMKQAKMSKSLGRIDKHEMSQIVIHKHNKICHDYTDLTHQGEKPHPSPQWPCKERSKPYSTKTTLQIQHPTAGHQTFCFAMQRRGVGRRQQLTQTSLKVTVVVIDFRHWWCIDISGMVHWGDWIICFEKGLQLAAIGAKRAATIAKITHKTTTFLCPSTFFNCYYKIRCIVNHCHTTWQTIK